MIKTHYHDFKNPADVLITGKDRKDCMQLFSWTAKVFAENSSPLGEQTNLFCIEENGVYQLILDGNVDFRFRLRFRACDEPGQLPDVADEATLVVYCARFEKEEGDRHSMLADEIETVFQLLNVRGWPYIILLTDTKEVIPAGAVPPWPAVHRELMRLSGGMEAEEDSVLTERGQDLLYGLYAVAENHLAGAEGQDIAGKFNFLYELNDQELEELGGFEWIFQFIGVLLSLDRYNYYQFLTHNFDLL